MDWNQVYRLSGNVFFHPVAVDEFCLRTLESGHHLDLDSTTLWVLSHFVEPASPADVFSAIREEIGVSREEFEAGIGEMIRGQVLVQVPPFHGMLSLSSVYDHPSVREVVVVEPSQLAGCPVEMLGEFYPLAAGIESACQGSVSECLTLAARTGFQLVPVAMLTYLASEPAESFIEGLPHAKRRSWKKVLAAGASRSLRTELVRTFDNDSYAKWHESYTTYQLSRSRWVNRAPDNYREEVDGLQLDSAIFCLAGDDLVGALMLCIAERDNGEKALSVRHAHALDDYTSLRLCYLRLKEAACSRGIPWVSYGIDPNLYGDLVNTNSLGVLHHKYRLGMDIEPYSKHGQILFKCLNMNRFLDLNHTIAFFRTLDEEGGLGLDVYTRDKDLRAEGFSRRYLFASLREVRVFRYLDEPFDVVKLM
jgi:hypothetical protein